MSNFSFEIDPSLAKRLSRLAERREVSSAEVAEIAIAAFVDQEESEIADIESAIVEAKRGDFASDAEVDAVFDKYVSLHQSK